MQLQQALVLQTTNVQYVRTSCRFEHLSIFVTFSSQTCSAVTVVKQLDSKEEQSKIAELIDRKIDGTQILCGQQIGLIGFSDCPRHATL